MRPIRLWLPVAVVAALAAALVPAASASRGDGNGRRWVRVQLDGPVGAADHARLVAAGAGDLLYVPDHAYLAAADGATRTRLAAIDGVLGVREVTETERVDPALRPGAAEALATVVVDAASAGRVLAGAAVHPLQRSPLRPGLAAEAIVTRVSAAQARSLARHPAVLYVGPAAAGAFPEDEGATQILAGGLQGSTPVPGYEPFLAARGLDGAGVTMTIADDGLDPTHPELAGRIAKRISYGPVGAYPAEGHGTHVAGIAGGAGASIPGAGRVKDASGLLYGIGVAPRMTFVDQNVIELVNSQVNPPRNPANLRQWVADAVRAGSIGWNASWHSGEGTGAGYIANAALLDGLTRDADPDAPGDQPFTMVFSAGNAGSGRSTITSPKEAKNIITVGNSLGHRAGNINTIASGSSRGPAKDGRILPTVAAPGSSIVSARAATGALCTTSPPADSYGLYSSCSGTSMAAPNVTGTVALLTQWWRKLHGGADPSPAMAKALIVNSARDMGVRNVPNGDEGWGRVDLAALFDPAASRFTLDQSARFTDVGQERSVVVHPVDPGAPLRVTVAWTDAPGAPGAAAALVNDLDLTVTAADGTVYRGNRFSKGASVPGGNPNRVDNLENVFIDVPSAGPYTVQVTVANLPGDGVPAAPGVDQDFALVVSNAAPAA